MKSSAPNGLGRTRGRIFECASEVLEGTEAFGSPLSIKRSYLEVERNNRHPAKAYRYAWFEQPLLDRLDIDANFGMQRILFPWRKRRDRAPVSVHRAELNGRPRKRSRK